MTVRAPAFRSQGVNQYVPKMQLAPNVNQFHPAPHSLGTPAVVSATAVTSGVAANAAATTIVRLTTPYVMDSPYGRTVRLTVSGDPGNAASVDVFGEDFLGAPMVERFTGASGSTAVLYGRKAFYRIFGTKIVTAASNAVTWSVGTGFRLGLPYKSDVAWAKEAGVFVPVQNRPMWFQVDRDAAEAIAGGSHYIRAPFAGYVKTLKGIASGAGSTNNPVITVELANVAIVGLTVTIDSDNAGNEVTDTPTTIGYNANNRFIAGGQVEIVGAAAASAGPDTVLLELDPTQFTAGDTTDPNLATSGDPRGTYEALVTYDATSEIIVGLLGDMTFNAAGNGGLHGIRQAALS